MYFSQYAVFTNNLTSATDSISMTENYILLVFLAETRYSSSYSSMYLNVI